METARNTGKVASFWQRHKTATVAALVSLSLLIGFGATTPVPFAQANDYPSWSEVEQARRDAANTQAAINRLNAAIETLNKELEPLREIAEQKGQIYFDAKEKLDLAQWEADQLSLKAKEAGDIAAESTRQAGILASQLNNRTSGDFGLSLFLKGDSADVFLYQLGMMNQLSSQTAQIFAQATADRNNALSLLDQAEVAKDALAEIAEEAEEAYNVAVEAQQAVENKLNEQQSQRNEMERMLILLKDNVRLTEDQYIAGVRERFGSGVNIDAGPISDHGWLRPVKTGYHTSAYGWRVHPINGTWSLHTGTDIAGPNYCQQPIYAATGGRVVYSGSFGGYGNFIRIDHGQGVETWYAHIAPGGLLVSYGDVIDPGHQIARVGTTGNSTGCHLHIEVRINGAHTDPVAYFRAKGINL